MEQMTLIAMRGSGRFEGDDPWANITGNFDDAGLTCGMLGKTFGDGDQQECVHRFLKQFGPGELLKLMPRRAPNISDSARCPGARESP